jgi:cysteine desulfurase
MPDEIDGSIFYTCTDVAEACGVSRQTIWRWRQYGLIPAGRTRRTGSVAFSQTELEYIRSHARQVDSRDAAAPTQVYLDNAASTKPLAVVRDAVMRAMDVDFGNPSSAHESGRRARQAVEDARDQVASLLGADRSHVTFTSGGTEANNLVLRHCHEAGYQRVITTAVEHSSILGVLDQIRAAGTEVTILDVDASGRISLDALRALQIDDETLVSVQWANNETGVIQPVLSIGEHVARCGGTFHCDAAQAVGKMHIDFSGAPIDAITITAHKIHGPQGIGALIAKSRAHARALMHGGSQERGVRPGTENFPGIVGFGTAAEHRLATMRNFIRHTRSLRDMFEARLREALAALHFNGADTDRVSTTGSVTIEGIDGQALVAQLDARGIRVSQSSACTNMRPEPSYVLRAMGLSEDAAYGTIRYAMSEDSTFEGCTRAAEAIVDIAVALGARRHETPERSSRREVA